MAFRAELDGVIVHADTPEELARLIRIYREGTWGAGRPTMEKAPASTTVMLGDDVGKRPGRNRKARQAQTIIPSANKAEAFNRVLDSIWNENHLRGLQFLAERGEQGAIDEDVRAAMGDGKKMSGFTSGLLHRIAAYGLNAEDVISITNLGIVMHRRITKYRLTPEFIAVINERRDRKATAGPRLVNG